MRMRDIDRVKVPGDWEEKAAQAREAVKAGAQKASQYAAVWTSVKGLLADLSHDKCWYCECRQERADNAVDHFRPKSTYPWYAFELRNFRYACTFCNSIRRDAEDGETGGKGDQFPLRDAAARARDVDSLEDEEPLLLDPCDPDDCGMLDFDAAGKPQPAENLSAEDRERVEVSIRVYHLDHSDLVEQRRLLALELERWIKAADRLQGKAKDPAVRNLLKSNLYSIAKRIDDASELSAFARRVLSFHRAKPWVQRLLG
jgi:uncharacterized protein (TIGR02646 family)